MSNTFDSARPMGGLADMPAADNARTGKIALWTGRVLSGLVAAMMIMSAVMKFVQPPMAVEGTERLGWTMDSAVALGIIEMAAAILLLIPQTAVLGAILLTGYLGGAIATHVRINDPFIVPALMGVVVWLAVFLREPRLRALLPWRRGT